MLVQFGGDRVGHDLAAMNFRRLAHVDRSMPTRLRVAMNGHAKIAGFDRCFTISFRLCRGPLLIRWLPD
jgi:hypothetical protein